MPHRCAVMAREPSASPVLSCPCFGCDAGADCVPIRVQGRAPPEAAIPQEPPSVSSPPPTAGLNARVAAKPSLNLLDFDGDSSAPPLLQPQQEQPAPAGVHALWSHMLAPAAVSGYIQVSVCLATYCATC